MKKLQKILMMTVLVAMLVGIFAVASSAAATMQPSQVLADFDGEKDGSVTDGTIAINSESALNKYYEIDFAKDKANANFGGSDIAFIGKGDYIVTEFDFMAEDWSTVKSLLIGWNSRNSSGGALNDMHFTFSNSGGSPKITGNPLAGSVTLNTKPGTWHHFTLIVQVGGTHAEKSGKLSAVQGQDAVEAYAYIDGKIFAKNLIGDGKEFWSKDTTFFQTLRITASGANQKICLDNIHIAQYEANRDLRDFFKYRQKNDGAYPDLNAVSYPFLEYDSDYEYPLGTPTLKVVEVNGTETMFDRFDRACKFASGLSGAKLVLLDNITGVVVKYPLSVDRAGFNFEFEVAPQLRFEEKENVNPITGNKTVELSFIKKTKYAYFSWEVDHTGEVLDSRGYIPVAIGSPVVYDGKEFSTQYCIDGVLYTFGGEWKLNGEVITTVPAYATNSYYTLVPVIRQRDVYATITVDETVSYALNRSEFFDMIAAAPAGAEIALLRDIEIESSLVINHSVVLDLAGKTLKVNGANDALVLSDGAAGSVIKSSVPGGTIEAEGAIFNAACSFAVNGENLFATGSALLKTEAALADVKFDGGVFVLSGAQALVLGAEASLSAEINAALVGKTDVVALIDSSANYALTLGGAIIGISLPASESSTVVLAEGLALSGVSALVGTELPVGVSFADEALVLATKKSEVVCGDVVLETNCIVAEKSALTLIVWEEGVSEYVVPGETVYYGYSDRYDTKKFYTPSGSYLFELDGEIVLGNVVSADWAGVTVTAQPDYDSKSFFVLAAKPDGSFDYYGTAINLADLISSGAYADGTVFVIGRKNMILEDVVVSGAYAIDLNGYALTLAKTNKIDGGALKIFSSAEGASFASAGARAFYLNGGTLEIEGVVYIGGTLAEMDAESTLKINGGAFILGDADFCKVAEGAALEIEALWADKQLFVAADGYAWIESRDEVMANGGAYAVSVKYEKESE